MQQIAQQNKTCWLLLKWADNKMIFCSCWSSCTQHTSHWRMLLHWVGCLVSSWRKVGLICQFHSDLWYILTGYKGRTYHAVSSYAWCHYSHWSELQINFFLLSLTRYRLNSFSITAHYIKEKLWNLCCGNIFIHPTNTFWMRRGWKDNFVVWIFLKACCLTFCNELLSWVKSWHPVGDCGEMGTLLFLSISIATPTGILAWPQTGHWMSCLHPGAIWQEYEVHFNWDRNPIRKVNDGKTVFTFNSVVLKFVFK